MTSYCLPLSLAAGLVLTLTANAQAPVPPTCGEIRPYAFSTPKVDNNGGVAAIAHEKVIRIPGASFLQIEFGAVDLPNGGWLEVTSLLDNDSEPLDETALRLRHGMSAYFNGEALRVRMIAGARSQRSSYSIRTLAVGKPLARLPMTICGTDDRVLSKDPRVSRIILRRGSSTSWCSAWLISATNCFATAGHCMSGLSSITAQFNVPLSSATGSLIHPPAKDQYVWEGTQGSFGSVSGGIGNDYGAFRTTVNSTGKHAGQNQGAFFSFVAAPSANAATRITGHGSDSTPTRTRNGTQQSNAGPFVGRTGNRLRYRADTTGGNSGSPVIDEKSQKAFGVHTHGGCNSSSTSSNSGTYAMHSGFLALRIRICGGVSGSYATFGQGCLGTGSRPTTCHSLNDTASNRNLTTRANLTYAVEVTAPRDLTINGFSLTTRSRTSGSVTRVARIYSRDASGRPGQVLRSGSMTIGAATGWYRTTFSSPLTLKSGTKFFVAFVNQATAIGASVTSGTNVNYFRNDGTGGSWNGPLGGFAWAYRIHCVGGSGAIPDLSSSGMPLIGGNFDLNVTSAAKNAGAVLFFGASDKTYAGLNLPFDLKVLRAPGCSLLASGEIQIPLLTNASGGARVTIKLPNDNGLVRAKFYNQVLVLDPKANPFGVSLTNGGAGSIGKQ